MGRGQMRNLETFGVGTGDINEFEYQKNQGELTEQLEHQGDREDAAPEPSTPAERVKQIIADAHQKVEERKRKGISRAGKKKTPAKKAPAKKAASRKRAARELTSKRATAKKSAKKSAARKSPKTSTTKTAARKSTKKVAANKSKARKR